MQITKTKNVVDLDKFNNEVIAHNAKISYCFKIGDDQLVFNIASALSPEENTNLDTFMANYVDADPTLKIPKIYTIVKAEAKGKHFHNIDYKKELMFSLIPKRTVTRGEVTQVDWYKSLDANQQPTNLILTVSVQYTRDATGFATYRTVIRKWINEDETENEEFKVTNKYYFVNPSDMITEGLKRRKLLVSSIQIPTLTFMMETLMPLGYTQESVVLQGRKFMDDYDGDFNRFVENSSTITDPADPNVGRKSIIVELEENEVGGRNNDYNLWLDKAPASLGGMITIRQYLISEFSI